MYIVNYVGQTAENIVLGLPIAALKVGVTSLETAGGVAAAAVSVATLGLFDSINRFANKAYTSANIITTAFRAVGRVINPDFRGHSDGAGIVTQAVAGPIHAIAMNTSHKPNFFAKHVISRIAYGLLAVTSCATRTADFALGILFGAVAFVPLFARSETVNTLALKHLSSTAVVGDITRAIRGVINPDQFVYKMPVRERESFEDLESLSDL